MRPALHTRLDAATIKQVVDPTTFYRAELPTMKAPPGHARRANGGLCPFHADTRPNSFFLNLDTGGFVCFSCGAKGGDVIAFLMARDGYTFRQALEFLAENYA